MTQPPVYILSEASDAWEEMLLEYWVACLVLSTLGVCAIMLCFECACLVPDLRRRRARVPEIVKIKLTQELVTRP